MRNAGKQEEDQEAVIGEGSTVVIAAFAPWTHVLRGDFSDFLPSCIPYRTDWTSKARTPGQTQQAITRLGSRVGLAKFSSKPCSLPTALSCERTTAKLGQGFVLQGHFSSLRFSSSVLSNFTKRTFWPIQRRVRRSRAGRQCRVMPQ
jgi:hypothetical protein